jgi:hypothetical protein
VLNLIHHLQRLAADSAFVVQSSVVVYRGPILAILAILAFLAILVSPPGLSPPSISKIIK